MSLQQDEKSPYPSLPYILPFAAFIILMGMGSMLGWSRQWTYPVQVLITSAILLLVSVRAFSWRAVRPFASMAVGIGVFVVWVAPDVLWPAYRHFWLFENSVTGSAASSLTTALRADYTFLAFRIFGTALVVPIIEELFWRGWLMRWIVSQDFTKVPLGVWSARAFWIVAALFAVEHGALWDVGLAAGILYNWWILRTKSLGDVIVAHGITNAVLSAYVIFAGRWEYWP